jgi:hypothetical protein
MTNERPSPVLAGGPISLPTIRVLLVSAIVSLSYLGLCAEIWERGLDLPDRFGLVEFFSLSFETNLPTWAASALHGSAALVLALIAASRAVPAGRGAPNSDRRIWWMLSAIFVYISIDETV